MNFLFVMKYRGDAGNVQGVSNYLKVAPRHGHKAAIYGTPLWYVSGLQFSTDISEFDRIIFSFESELFRVNRLREATMLSHFPRHRRLILDSDGMYNPYISLGGYDSNHRDAAQSEYWISYFDALADRIVQPTVRQPILPRAMAMPFYGYNAELEVKPSAAPRKQYDILHLAHNWWRWREVESQLLPAFEEIRGQIGEIAFIGLWWDKPPVEGLAAGPALAFQSDLERLKRLRVHLPKSVMYNDVIRTMSSAKINIMTQRPVLRELRHLTMKYFEVFYADTIPLLMLDDDHAEAVYGTAARELTLPGRVAEKILDALHRPDHYRGIVEDIRRHLRATYSYDRLVGELAASMPN